MEAQNGVLGWAFAHALARLCGASFGFAALWIFMRLWGDAPGSGPALVQLGLMLVAGLIQGALLGLLPGQVLLRLLPEADFEAFVRNTTLVVGLEHLLAMLPVTLATLSAGPTPELAYWSHTLASVGFALALGPAQWLALRRYARARQYVVASSLAQLAGLVLEWLAQALLPSFELDLPAIALRLAWAALLAGLVALPTGWVLVRMQLQPQPP
jgi:hypothetical protein